MDTRTYFKPQLYMNRLNKYAVNAYYVDFLRRKGNLRDILIKARTVNSRETIAELFSDHNIWAAPLTEKEKE